jgi:hypothetical protein
LKKSVKKGILLENPFLFLYLSAKIIYGGFKKTKKKNLREIFLTVKKYTLVLVFSVFITGDCHHHALKSIYKSTYVNILDAVM